MLKSFLLALFCWNASFANSWSLIKKSMTPGSVTTDRQGFVLLDGGLVWNFRTHKLHHAKEGENDSRYHDSYVLARVEEDLADRLDSSQKELEYIQIPTSSSIPAEKGCPMIAKKSARGAVAPPAEKHENKITCYLCPGVFFSSLDVLRIHCFEEHQITDYIRKDLACRPLVRLNKCDFCIYRSPHFSKLTSHLTEFHTAEDIYLKCLSTSNRQSAGRRLIPRKRKAQEPIKHDDILFHCPVCEDVKSSREQLTTHLENEHKIHRNTDLLLSYSFKIMPS